MVIGLRRLARMAVKRLSVMSRRFGTAWERLGRRLIVVWRFGFFVSCW